MEERIVKILEAVNAGRTYTVIAEEFNVTRQRIQQISKKYGGIQRREEGPKPDHTLFMRLYRSGMTDKTISAICGNHQTTVFEWRKSKRLPANRHFLDTTKKAYQLRQQGMRYKEIGKLLNLKDKTVQAACSRYDLHLQKKR